MHIADTISPERIVSNAQATSKKCALERLSSLVASNEDKLVATEVFDSLVARERLGSTGIGHGVAIPHGRLGKLDHAVSAFMRLEKGVDFDAIDNEPVAYMFALLVPKDSNDDHLQLLAQLAKMFSNPAMRERLRLASSSEELYELLSQTKKDDSAVIE
ncbi:MAG: PTS IIA-like nitrogen regulatory protein PtsN [Gammaproteobacteria bacterium]|nr:PTS IIA-like nitrogen regulatory protein PtsN [Gammaproteobacteria bacterium]